MFDAIFLILPFVCEIIFVAATMLVRVDVAFAAILLATLVVYGTVLVIGSEWLRAHQRRAVARGAMAHGQAIDSLLNYETIKYFNREELIARRYDGSLAEVERLTVKSLRFRSTIGVVLVTIIACGMAAMLLLATVRVAAGAMTLGELVLVNTYLLQLIRPMERLGQLYRSIKQSLVDLEQLLALLDEQPEVVDRAGRDAAASRARARSPSSTSRSTTAPAAAPSRTSASRWRRAARSRSSARPAPASPASPGCCSGSTTRARAAS